MHGMWYYLCLPPSPAPKLKETHIILQKILIFTYFIYGENAFRRWERRGILQISFVKLTRESAVLCEIKILESMVISWNTWDAMVAPTSSVL